MTITRSRMSASCLGARFAQALGDRSGIRRFGEATVPLDEALCTAVVDISGRSYLAYNVEISQERVGNFQTVLVHDFMKALTDETGMNLHLNLSAAAIRITSSRRLSKRWRARWIRRRRASRAFQGVLSTKGTLSS